MEDIEFLKSADDKLSAGSEETRYSAVRDLVRLNSIEMIPHLLKAVGDLSCRIREEALKGIFSFPREVIFPKLEDLLRNHEHANLRTIAIDIFHLYGKEATPYLIRLLKDQDKEVRILSATILGEVRDSAAVDHLIEALNDPDENVKHASAESLGKIGDDRAVGPLIDCLHQDIWIQYPAVNALGNIGDPSATKHLVELLNDDKLREAVTEALEKIGDISVIQKRTG